LICLNGYELKARTSEEATESLHTLATELGKPQGV